MKITEKQPKINPKQPDSQSSPGSPNGAPDTTLPPKVSDGSNNGVAYSKTDTEENGLSDSGDISVKHNSKPKPKKSKDTKGSKGGKPPTHGLSKTPTYTSYKSAKNRCNNQNHPQYKNYGGRGIEFRFSGVLELVDEIGLRPADKSLDRIDTNGHYEPGNVRWATPTEQAASRRPDVRRKRLDVFPGNEKSKRGWEMRYQREREWKESRANFVIRRGNQILVGLREERTAECYMCDEPPETELSEKIEKLWKILARRGDVDAQHELLRLPGVSPEEFDWYKGPAPRPENAVWFDGDESPEEDKSPEYDPPDVDPEQAEQDF